MKLINIQEKMDEVAKYGLDDDLYEGALEEILELQKKNQELHANIKSLTETLNKVLEQVTV